MKKNWIQKAIKNPGALREEIKRKFGEKAFSEKGNIKIEYLNKLQKTASPKTKKRIVLAKTLRKINK